MAHDDTKDGLNTGLEKVKEMSSMQHLCYRGVLSIMAMHVKPGWNIHYWQPYSSQDVHLLRIYMTQMGEKKDHDSLDISD